MKILPPDFTFNELRGGDALADIYRAIAAGIGGTAMPTWKNVLPDPTSGPSPTTSAHWSPCAATPRRTRPLQRSPADSACVALARR